MDEIIKDSELVSIIIPVYNVECYLRDCVNSVLQQTYSKIEIILVDDGSTDGSGRLCDTLQEESDKIVVIHKKNGGLSDARNFGIDRASGRYICFIDSDDLIANDYVESMKNNMSREVKISACGYCHYYDSGKKVKINFENICHYYKGVEAQKYLNIIGYFNVSACNKLFEKTLFDEIRFPIGKKSEDWYVMYKLIEKAGGIYYNSDIKYYYRQRNGSITKSTTVNDAAINAAGEVYNYYLAKGWGEAVPYAAQSLAFANIGVYNAYLCGAKDKEAMKRIRQDTIAIKKSITLNGLSQTRKMQLVLFIRCKILYDIAFKMFDLKRKTNK